MTDEEKNQTDGYVAPESVPTAEPTVADDLRTTTEAEADEQAQAVRDNDDNDDEFALFPELQDEAVIPPEEASSSPYEDDVDQDDLEGLGGPGDAPRTPSEAIRNARQKANSSYDDGAGWCLKNVREYYGVGAFYATAIDAWDGAATKHRVTDAKNIPRGVPVFWRGGSQGFGHIAISVGDGKCYSTDWAADGSIGLANINDISSHWGQDLLGYAREVNEVIVWTPKVEGPTKPRPPGPVEKDKVRLAIGRLRESAAMARRRGAKDRADKLEAWARKLRDTFLK